MIKALKPPFLLVARILPILLLLLPAACDRFNPPAEPVRMDRMALFGDKDLVVHFSDTQAFFQALAVSPWGQLWKSEAMAAFRNDRDLGQDLLEAVAAGSAETEDRQIRQIYLDQLKLLRGEVIVGLDFSNFEADPAFTLAARMQEADFNLSLEMDKRLFQLEEKETLSAVENFRGVKLYTYITKEDEGDRFVHQAFCRGTLLASENRNWVEQAVVRLLETPAREPQGVPVFSVSGRRLMFDRLKAELARSANAKGKPLDVQALIHALGIDALGDIDFALRLGTDRLEADFRVGRQGEWNRGLMVVFPEEAAPLDLRLAYVPPDPMYYQVSRLNLNALWQEIPRMLGAVSPEMQMQFSMAVNAMAGMARIDLNRDLFGNLDGLLFSFARLEGNAQQMLYGLKVRDAAAMGRTLERLFGVDAPLAAQLGEMYARADIQGQVVHTVRFRLPAPKGQPAVYGDIGLTVLDRALVIGQGALVLDYVQSSLHRAEAPAFYTSEGFRTLAAQLPSGATSYSLSDFSQYARQVLQQIRQIASAIAGEAENDAAAEGRAAEDAQLAAFLQSFDFDRLPADDEIGRYMGTGTSHSRIDANGLQVALTIHYPQL